MLDDAPYALGDFDVRRRRRAMLSQPHVKPLCEYLDAIRASRGPGCEIPDFDPLDGGIDASALFLFASPGGGVGTSGFVSRENTDQVARHFAGFSQNAGLSRKDMLVWNIVPWQIDGEMDESDIAAAFPFLKELIEKLPEIRVIVLFGTYARSLHGALSLGTNALILECCMPSQRVFNRWKGKEAEVQKTFDEVARILAR